MKAVMIEELANRIKRRVVSGEGVFKSDYCEFDELSALFDQEVRIYMFLDQPFKLGVSNRQLKLLQEFLSLNEDSLDVVKNALLGHWDNGSDYWDCDIELQNGEDAYKRSQLGGLFIMQEDHCWGNEASQIRFNVPWDTEHGAGVFIRDGRINGFGDL
jgi:hypothetical protein